MMMNNEHQERILKHLPCKMIEENNKKKLNAMLNWIICNTTVIVINQIADKVVWYFKVIDWVVSIAIIITIVLAKCKNYKLTYLAFALLQIRYHYKMFQKENILDIDN